VSLALLMIMFAVGALEIAHFSRGTPFMLEVEAKLGPPVGAGARGRGNSVAESIELIAVECPVLSRRNGRRGSFSATITVVSVRPLPATRSARNSFPEADIGRRPTSPLAANERLGLACCRLLRRGDAVMGG
jgi:hypothetical protein